MTNRSDYYQFETIDWYLKGQMTEAEERDFIEVMKGDPELRHEVDRARIFLTGMENLETAEIRKELKQTDRVLQQIRASTLVDFDSDKGESGKLKPGLWDKFIPDSQFQKIGGIAAMLVAVLGGMYFLLFDKPDPQALYEQYYQKPPNIIAVENRSAPNEKSAIASVIKPYEEGHYKKALKKANQYLENHPDKTKVQFYRGIMHLELGQYQRAIQDLKTATNLNEAFRHKALWYLALTHLAEGETGEAGDYLKQLKEGQPSPYREKALELYEKLN